MSRNNKYGPDHYRRKTVMTDSNMTTGAETVIYTRYYDGNYEKEINATGTKEFYYISGPVGIIAVYIVTNGSGQLYYTLTDHLGSIVALMDESGTIVEETNYDPCSMNFEFVEYAKTNAINELIPTFCREVSTRNPNTWHYDNTAGLSLIFRGFTGHEMLPEFGLINMNGRLYDPALGRFLSPDNYVQDPYNPQNYNRYAYCFNNPLKYTDPDGELFWFIPVIIGAVVGAYAGASIQSGTAAFWDWQPDAWKGAIVGGIVGASIGYSWSLAVGPAGGITYNTAGTGKMIWNITGRALLNADQNMFVNILFGNNSTWQSGIEGLVSGALTRGIDYKREWTKGFFKNFLMQGTIGSTENALNKWIEGKPITLENTLKSYAINGIIGGVSGGLKSAYEGKNFWTGEYRKIYYGKGCYYQVFNEGWKYKNPKGAFSLATGFRVGKNKVLHFALLGYKINMNPSWVRNSQIWPNYWRNSPILFPGMIWFTEY